MRCWLSGRRLTLPLRVSPALRAPLALPNHLPHDLAHALALPPVWAVATKMMRQVVKKMWMMRCLRTRRGPGEWDYFGESGLLFFTDPSKNPG